VVSVNPYYFLFSLAETRPRRWPTPTRPQPMARLCVRSGRVGARVLGVICRRCRKYAMYAQAEQLTLPPWPSFDLRGGARAWGDEVNKRRQPDIRGRRPVASCSAVRHVVWSRGHIELLCVDDTKKQPAAQPAALARIYATRRTAS